MNAGDSRIRTCIQSVSMISPATASVPASPALAIPFYGLLLLGGLLGLVGLREIKT
jgi:hypothetical protein